ncbi:uncharacterized protein LOC130568445 isoform X2 [Triplophysa rosa]|uniref:uncharacterized protein LOC130568445 isoform X2 n=1 Tax=Triplophysa rosa TaxID=992332 RepID=UPI002545C8DB|nr:uncharacterized protein LOC130568445 isoform X2 [Triplophysa rosa]
MIPSVEKQTPKESSPERSPLLPVCQFQARLQRSGPVINAAPTWCCIQGLHLARGPFTYSWKSVFGFLCVVLHRRCSQAVIRALGDAGAGREREPGGRGGSVIRQHSVAILIPYRNREKHLLYFLYHRHPFLQRQQLHYTIYVIHRLGSSTITPTKSARNQGVKFDDQLKFTSNIAATSRTCRKPSIPTDILSCSS